MKIYGFQIRASKNKAILSEKLDQRLSVQTHLLREF
jgi:hypothetical protein